MRPGHAARLLLGGFLVAGLPCQGNGSAVGVDTGQPGVSAGKQDVAADTDFLLADAADVAPVATDAPVEGTEAEVASFEAPPIATGRFPWWRARARCYSNRGQGAMPDARTSE